MNSFEFNRLFGPTCRGGDMVGRYADVGPATVAGQPALLAFVPAGFVGEDQTPPPFTMDWEEQEWDATRVAQLRDGAEDYLIVAAHGAPQHTVKLVFCGRVGGVEVDVFRSAAGHAAREAAARPNGAAASSARLFVRA